MSDLISRNEVIKLVNQFVFGLCKEQNDEVRKTFNKYIEKIPTAYSVEKVVEKLEEIRAKKTCNKEKCDTKEICRICVVDDAIEIVKHGGVSDDVCKWKLDGDNLTTGCGDYFNLYDNCTGKFKYCPRCGKKIKAVDQMDEEDFCYCHYDYEDEYHDCLDYMECEECPYYYADLDQESD